MARMLYLQSAIGNAAVTRLLAARGQATRA
jgi:hypothetical protein